MTMTTPTDPTRSMSPMTAADGRPYTLQVCDWAAAGEDAYAVRRRVFVDEQGVSPQLEQDGRDNDAGCRHVLARTPAGTNPDAAAGAPIATGRLLGDGHIGRLAVLPDWRGFGVGRAVLVRLIELARERGLAGVYLNAQTGALEFYRRLGFRAEGEAFVEAGIGHRRMRLELAGWSPETAEPRVLEGAADSVTAARELIAGARRRLCVYTPYMHPRFYGADELAAALGARLREQPRLQVQLLLPPVAQWRRQCPRLAELVQRFGAFELRCWPASVPRERAEFTLGFWLAEGDRLALLLHTDTRSLSGRYLPSSAPAGADDDGPSPRQLQGFFDSSWEHSQPDTELRRLGL